MKELATIIFAVEFSSTLKIKAAGLSETFICISRRIPGTASQQTALFTPQTSQTSSVNKSASKFKLPEMYHLRDVMNFFSRHTQEDS
jgi:hypothetical protein